jgi:hypothetical protein
MTDFVFSDKLAEAQQAEEYAHEFLSEQRGVVRVIDVRKDAAWQRRDIDFRAVMKNGVLNVEAKADRHISRTSNILFELCHINYEQPPERRTRPGWSVYSAAHLFLVYCPETGVLHSIKASDLRAALPHYARSARGQIKVTLSTSEQAKWATVNVLIPMQYVPHRRYIRAAGAWVEI